MRKTIVLLIITILLIGCDKKSDSVEGTSMQIQSDVKITINEKYINNALELVDSSDLIFTGTVKNITYQMLNVDINSTNSEDLLPYTIYEITVSKVYKGTFNNETIYIKRNGGIFDGINYVLEDATPINLNCEYLFCAIEFSESYPSFVNSKQAVYNLDSNSEESTNQFGNEILFSDIMEIVE